jgi:hypothetical protein
MNHHISLESSTSRIERRVCAKCEARMMLARTTQPMTGSLENRC